MARMFRVSHLFAKWESSMEINYHRLSLAKFALVFLFASHWMACLWHMVTVMETLVNPNVVDSWVSAYNRQHRVPLGSAAELYITSLYWATVTMSTIGMYPFFSAFSLVGSCTCPCCVQSCGGTFARLCSAM